MPPNLEINFNNNNNNIFQKQYLEKKKKYNTSLVTFMRLNLSVRKFFFFFSMKTKKTPIIQF